MLYFFYLKLNHNSDLANDFLQDLFLKIIENPLSFDCSKKFSTWIYTLALNMCKNEYKKNTIRGAKILDFDFNTILDDSISSTILDNNDRDFFNKQLASELNRLDELHSTTFILRFKQHLSIKEISEIMECSEGTVKSRLFYTIKKLSSSLKIFDPNIY